jgi:8-oxo-dGTP diphosphatase
MLGDRHMILLLYMLRKWRGIPRALHASALSWVRPIELHGLEMPPADRPLIGLLDALI